VDEEREKSGPSAGNAFTIAGVLLVCYVLSPGPIIAMLGGHPSPGTEKILDIFFYPLGQLYDHFPSVHAFYDAYFRLLGVK